MRVSMSLTLVFCLFVCFSVGDAAQEKPDVATVRALESKWADSYRHRDIPTLTSLLADDYVITTEDGNTYGKVGFVSYNAGPLRVDVAEMSDLKIRMHENIAVLTGAYREKGESNGKPYDYHDRFTDVWMKLNGKWLLIASHYSLPAASS